ncbi:MAG: hypothetical protein KF690_06120 [Bacteroidetes bacterium]|nr:hypothetical protein [Bacteroidota bacterium]
MSSCIRSKSTPHLIGECLLLLGTVLVISLYTWIPWILNLGISGDIRWSFIQEYIQRNTTPHESVNQVIHNNLRHHVLFAVAVIIIPGLAFRFGNTRWMLERVLGGATALSLAYIRILVSVILVFAYLFEPLQQLALFPSDQVVNMGFGLLANWMPRTWPGMFGTEAFWYGWRTLLILVLVGYALGWKTRVVSIVAAVMVFCTESWIRGYTEYYNHQHLVSLYVVLVLAFFPSGDTCSLDNYFRKRKGRAIHPLTPSMTYSWGRFFVFLVIGLAYTEAGLSKLMHQGWFWFDGEGIYGLAKGSTLSHTNFSFNFAYLDIPMWFYTLLGLGTIIFELLAAPAILFWKTARWVLPFAISSMHIGILLFMHIMFNDLIILPFVLIPIESIYTRFRSAGYPGFAAPAAKGYSYNIKLVLATLITSASLLIVRYQVELFPFTAFQMFSYHLSEDMNAYEISLHVIDKQGNRAIASLEKDLGFFCINQRFGRLYHYSSTKRDFILDNMLKEAYPNASAIQLSVRYCKAKDCPQGLSDYVVLFSYPEKPNP